MSWFHSKLNASNGELGEKLCDRPIGWGFWGNQPISAPWRTLLYACTCDANLRRRSAAIHTPNRLGEIEPQPQTLACVTSHINEYPEDSVEEE